VIIRPFLLISILALASCKYFKKKSGTGSEAPIARVQDAYLYPSGLREILKRAHESGDSARFVNNYVQDWIKRQLMIQKALLYLPDENLDVERQVNDYRQSLILYAYEKELILQKLDTSVSEAELRGYYEQYKNNFELDNDLAQLHYVKTAMDAPRRDSLLAWLVSDSEADRMKLEDYCHQYAVDFSLSDSLWMDVPAILKTMPVSLQQLEAIAGYRSRAAVNDSAHYCVLKINDFRKKGETAPFEFVKDEILRIILNKRKMDLIRSTYDNIYAEAERNKEFEIYE